MLITGANGVVGSDLVKFFSKSTKVFAIYRTSNIINRNLKNKNIIWINHDLKNKLKFKIKPKVIIHCAVTHALSRKNSYENFINSNILGFKNILEFAKKSKTKKIFHLSTLNVYGDIKTKVLTEQNPIINPDFLGVSKILMEKILEKEKINYLNIRLPGVVGYQINDPRRPWLCKIENNLMLNNKVEIFNSYKLFNNIIDTVEIYNFINFLKKSSFKNGILNFSASRPIKLKDIINYSKEKLNSKSKISYNAKKNKHFIISVAKCLRDYNYRPATTKKIVYRYIKSFTN